MKYKQTLTHDNKHAPTQTDNQTGTVFQSQTMTDIQKICRPHRLGQTTYNLMHSKQTKDAHTNAQKHTYPIFNNFIQTQIQQNSKSLTHTHSDANANTNTDTHTHTHKQTRDHSLTCLRQIIKIITDNTHNHIRTCGTHWIYRHTDTKTQTHSRARLKLEQINSHNNIHLNRH